MGEEMKGTTRYLDATVMEYALLDHARLRTPYGTQDDVRAYAAGGEKAALHDLALALADNGVPDRNIVDHRVGHGPHVPRRRDGGLRGA